MVSPADGKINVLISETEAGERIDKVLAGKGLGFSRSELQRFIEQSRILVGGQPIGNRYKVRAGDRVEIHPLPPPASTALPEDIPLSILFEDEHVLVIDKPAGLVVHPAVGHYTGTLVNAILGRHVDEALGTERPGIVHRLDKDTSGVMIVAKTPQARDALIPQFKAHSIERRYVAIVMGHMPTRVTYDTLHGRHPVHRKKFTSRLPESKMALPTVKRAVTHIEVLERLHATCLVQCRLETGRTHQIRVHLSENGFPILADPVYGKSVHDSVVREASTILGRQALHAATLGFIHPVTQEKLRFEAPLPANFAQALDLLRAAGPHKN